MKNYFFILIFSFSVLLSFSQKDTSKIKLLSDEKKVLTISTPIKAINSDKKIIQPTEIELNNDAKITAETISNSLKKNKSEPIKEFVLEQPKPAKDILVKNYWMGKDITDDKILSSVSLGNVNTKSKKIKIEFKDFGLIDGDRIKIFLNENTIKQNIVLSGNYFFIYINLEPGFNRIDFQALNEGSVGPNTAAINVFDDSGNLIASNQWNLTLNEIATLGVIKRQ